MSFKLCDSDSMRTISFHVTYGVWTHRT